MSIVLAGTAYLFISAMTATSFAVAMCWRGRRLQPLAH
jgi:hypothetical protein